MSLGNARYLSGAAAVMGALILSSCTVVVEEPLPPPGPDPIICTQEYAPVCGRRGGNVRTFGNACQARARGYSIIHRGECRRADDDPQFCPRVYRPVCARRGGHVRTFGNACEADAADYRVISRGPC